MEIDGYFKPNTVYAAKHLPTGESWIIIGISRDYNKVCAAGYPPSIGNLMDCYAFVELRPIEPNEIEYRTKMFGNNWI